LRRKIEFQEFLRISMKCRFEVDCWKQEASEHFEECQKQCE
jgi:hypothetical protein